MLLIKITLTVSGDQFIPKMHQFVSTKKWNIISSNNPKDIQTFNKKEFGYGSISFMHPNIFVKLGSSAQYEEDFIEFFEKNHALFLELGAEDFDFFTEIYYSGSQCNFEIFDRSMLVRLYKLQKNIAFPISIYHLKKDKIRELWVNSKLEL
jgi:hypothetical protein